MHNNKVQQVHFMFLTCLQFDIWGAPSALYVFDTCKCSLTYEVHQVHLMFLTHVSAVWHMRRTMCTSCFDTCKCSLTYEAHHVHFMFWHMEVQFDIWGAPSALHVLTRVSAVWHMRCIKCTSCFDTCKCSLTYEVHQVHFMFWHVCAVWHMRCTKCTSCLTHASTVACLQQAEARAR
jgi:hypothetical protein